MIVANAQSQRITSLPVDSGASRGNQPLLPSKKRSTRDFTIAPVERSSAGTLPLLQKTKMCRPVPPNFLQNFPALRAGISTRNRVKGPKFSGATRRETHHHMSPHIFNMRLQPCFPAWAGGRAVPLTLGAHHMPFGPVGTTREPGAQNMVGVLDALRRARRRGGREKGFG